MKTGVQTFIEKAIEGGWDGAWKDMCSHCGGGGSAPGATCSLCGGSGYSDDYMMEEMCDYINDFILDTDVWKAVAKTEGRSGVYIEAYTITKMHHMIDHIAKGGTPESYLKQLFGI